MIVLVQQTKIMCSPHHSDRKDIFQALLFILDFTWISIPNDPASYIQVFESLELIKGR